MPNPVPLISVILVCRNPGDRLRVALESVWSQAEPDLEVVVVDGASSDGSLEWLQTQRDRLATLISEPDRGIYEAMNKGIAHARGEWIMFLGADDRLVPELTAELMPELAHTKAEVVVGEAVYDDGRRYPLGKLTQAIRRNFVHHQAAFYRRAVFARHGSFRTDLRLMADYDFNLRLLQAGAVFHALPVCIAHCGRGGASDRGAWTGYAEEIRVRHEHFPAWRAWFWDGVSVARFFRKQLVR